MLDSMGAPHEPPNSLNNRDAANVQLPEVTTTYLSVESESWVPPAPPWFLGLVKNVRRNFADLHLVAVYQHRRIHRLPVDVGAVEATDVDDVEFVVLPPELRVPAAHSDVVEKNVAAGMSATDVTG